MAMYEMLASLPPFSRCNCPLSVNVNFETNGSTMLQGSYDVDPHTITLSTKLNKTYQQALETMAHEMVHLCLERKGASDHADHDTDFNALAAKVCNAWGWDFRKF